MPPSSWKDYAAAPAAPHGHPAGNGHHTNYAYEHFEADPRGMPPLPPVGGPRGGHHHYHPQMPSHPNGSLQKPRPSGSGAGSYSRSYNPSAGYSLPRNGSGGYGGPPPPPPGYGSYDRRGYHGRPPTDFPPDHYFMPSQRKYGGETVRIYRVGHIFWPFESSQISDVVCTQVKKKIWLKYSYDSSPLWHIAIFQQNLPHAMKYCKMPYKGDAIWHAPLLKGNH